ncbi:hypothetical protein ACLKA6_000477 [Drosophila palustris]
MTNSATACVFEKLQQSRRQRKKKQTKAAAPNQQASRHFKNQIAQTNNTHPNPIITETCPADQSKIPILLCINKRHLLRKK